MWWSLGTKTCLGHKNGCPTIIPATAHIPKHLHPSRLAVVFFFTRNEMRHQSAKLSNKTVEFSPTPRNGGHTPPHAASVRGHRHQLSPSDQAETWQTSEPRHTRGWSTTSVSTPVPSCAGALVARTVRGLWPADPQTTSLPLTTCPPTSRARTTKRALAPGLVNSR